MKQSGEKRSRPYKGSTAGKQKGGEMPKVYLTEEARIQAAIKREMRKEAEAAFLFMKENRISQSKIAEMTGITQGAVSYQLRTARISPDIRAALNILRKERKDEN